MTSFAPLDAILEQAERQGRVITFWWRDDDAVAASPDLEQLLELSHRHGVPLSLAVIPAALDPSLVTRLKAEEHVSVLAHGHSHANHAPPGIKKAEFGPHRPTDIMAEEAGHGLKILRDSFPTQQIAPVFVPPWNRMDPTLPPLLPALGYRALSTFAERHAAEAALGLAQINTHLDPIDWHGSRSLTPPTILISGLVAAIARRLRGETAEPIGLLTHHLVHDREIWNFCNILITRLKGSPSVTFADIRSLL